MVSKADQVWHATLNLIDRRGTFTAKDVMEALGDESPTKRTILTRLDAMESLGLLSSEGGAGRAPRVFFPPAPMPDGGMAAPETQPPDNQVSVFPYPGGKGRQSEWILDKMPPHDTYVEVFGGSGALLYNKPISKNEIYNDLNDDLTQFFTVLREREDDLVDWLQTVPYSRSLYNEWVEDFFQGERPDDPVERAARFFTLRFMQFGGDISMQNGFKVRAKRSPARTFDNARERIHDLAQRFRQVIIENRDYSRIFDTYDDTDVDVLFYADPPYVDKEHYYGVEFDHAEFVTALDAVESDWMVSYDELPDGLEDYTILSRERRHRMARGGSVATEHLVCNFDPADRPQFISDDLKQVKLGE